MFDEKAQLHTLEGVAAATLLLMVIIYAIDATSITPLTASTANVHIESELAILGQDILNTLDYAEPGYNSRLKNDLADIKKWVGKEYVWNGARYVSVADSSTFTNNLTEILGSALASKGIAHNVELTYLRVIDNVTTPYTSKFIYNGDPSDNAVIVSRKIVLQNDDCTRLTGEDCSKNNGDKPIDDIDPSTNLYNVIDVRLILWRT